MPTTNQPEFLARHLHRALAPVEAPGELWTRVAAGSLPARVGSRPRSAFLARVRPPLAMATAIAAALTAGVIYLRAYSPAPPAAPATTTLATTAASLHRGQPLPAAAPRLYAVQRYPESGATLISLPESGAPPPAPPRLTHRTLGDLSVSEWSAAGRRWVLVASPAQHDCRTCHHA